MYLLVVRWGVRWCLGVWVLFTNTYVGVRLRIAGHGFVFGGSGGVPLSGQGFILGG